MTSIIFEGVIPNSDMVVYIIRRASGTRSEDCEGSVRCTQGVIPNKEIWCIAFGVRRVHALKIAKVGSDVRVGD